MSPANACESNNTIWNIKQPLLSNTEGVFAESNESAPVAVYKYTLEDGKTGINVKGKSEEELMITVAY